MIKTPKYYQGYGSSPQDTNKEEQDKTEKENEETQHETETEEKTEQEYSAFDTWFYGNLYLEGAIFHKKVLEGKRGEHHGGIFR